MARNLAADLDSLTEQLAGLRASLVREADTSTKAASAYLAPRARQLAKEFRREGYDLGDAVRRNPATATGAIFGALALGALIGLLLSSSKTEE